MMTPAPAGFLSRSALRLIGVSPGCDASEVVFCSPASRVGGTGRASNPGLPAWAMLDRPFGASNPFAIRNLPFEMVFIIRHSSFMVLSCPRSLQKFSFFSPGQLSQLADTRFGSFLGFLLVALVLHPLRLMSVCDHLPFEVCLLPFEMSC